MVAAALVQDRSEASDIVQHAAMIAIERIDQFSPSTADSSAMEFARWMTAIVRNVAANARRKNKLRRAVSLIEADAIVQAKSDVASGTSNDQHVDFDQRSLTFNGIDGAFDDQLRSALQSLSEISRICLLLNVVLHITLDEIAQLLDVPSGTVASHVSRAKKTLRDLLRDYRGPAV
ncbi:MAG: RNA polymerase sigma factor [Pirellulaceae bacterium]|nr:RNA polymerase sigma factor [Pirellulaceae bacterium]